MTKTTVQYCSDLHLEFADNSAFIKTNPIVPKAEILILAGDIIPLVLVDKFAWFFDLISTQFKTVYWIAGNHEYYGYDLKEKSGVFMEVIRENIFLVNNYVLEFVDVKIIFSTLWSKISANNWFEIQYGMSDFHQIRYGNRRFNPDDYNLLYKNNLAFIKAELAKTTVNEKVIIVSHHVPTYQNYPEKYKNSTLNDAFATELAPLIQEYDRIKYWIYGHSHCNVPDFKIGEAVLTNNQLGYVSHREHYNFRADKTLLI